MDALFYRWFLAELLAALEGMEAGDSTSDATVIAPSPNAQTLSASAGVVTPRGQSILTPRPRQHAVTATVDGRTVLLGDGKRFAPPLMPPALQGAVSVGSPPWLPPWPVMPPQTKGTSVAWDGPDHAAHVHYAQEDGLFGHPGYDRASSDEYCAEPMGTVVEVSGVFSTPAIRRCDADWRTHPEHLATTARYNLRLPVMAGVDATGRYLRVAKLPLQTFEYRAPNTGGGGGGGDPT